MPCLLMHLVQELNVGTVDSRDSEASHFLSGSRKNNKQIHISNGHKQLSHMSWPGCKLG